MNNPKSFFITFIRFFRRTLRSRRPNNLTRSDSVLSTVIVSAGQPFPANDNNDLFYVPCPEGHLLAIDRRQSDSLVACPSCGLVFQAPSRPLMESPGTTISDLLVFLQIKIDDAQIRLADSEVPEWRRAELQQRLQDDEALKQRLLPELLPVPLDDW